MPPVVDVLVVVVVNSNGCLNCECISSSFLLKSLYILVHFWKIEFVKRYSLTP